MATIKNWSILFADKNDEEYASPEQYLFCFTGIVYGHPKLPDGEPIRTGRISKYKNGYFTTVNNTIYILGEINSKYEQEYPNAYGRLVNTAERYLQEE